MKQATTVEQQIEMLRNRGMTIDLSEEKTKENLSDIGYFRLKRPIQIAKLAYINRYR